MEGARERVMGGRGGVQHKEGGGGRCEELGTQHTLQASTHYHCVCGKGGWGGTGESEGVVGDAPNYAVCIQVTYLSHARYTTPSPSVPGPTAMLRYYAPCPPSPGPHHHAGANADSSFREEVGEEGEGEHDVKGG